MTITTDRAASNSSMKKYLRIGAVLLVVGLFAAAYFLFPVEQYLDELLTWVRGLGVLGGVVFGAAYVVAAVLFIPGSLITLAAGFAFGVVWGTVIVSISSTVGAALSFLLGRYVASDWIASKIEDYPRFHAVYKAIEKEGFKVVLLSRLVPFFPFGMLNYGFGVTKVDFGKYVLGSWIGMLPATIVYVYIGSVAGSLVQILTGEVERTTLQNSLFIGGAVASVLVLVFLTKRARREFNKITAEAEKESAKQEAPPNLVEQDELVQSAPQLLDDDAHDRELVDNVHPDDWRNPTPEGPYNLVVIGAGTGGLVSAAGAAGLGAKVALVEKNLMGGDCLNHGCVPSKALLRAARAVHDVRHAHRFGVEVDAEPRVDFAAVMERMRKIRAQISHHDSAERFDGLGIDVFLGEAKFVGEHTVEVDGQRLEFKKAIIATGARPFVPPIDGLAEAGFLTNETVFSLTELPERLAVVGGGPIGCELAQAFRRFGAEVVLFEMQDQLLPREDRDAADIVERAMRDDGVDLRLGAQVSRVDLEDGAKAVEFDAGESTEVVHVDEILVAIGRRPNVEGLGADAAGVLCDLKHGIEVDDRLQSSNPDIFAVGDCTSKYQFTHVADAQARIAIQNALFFGRSKASALHIPWATYTDPEIAHVGLYADEAREQGIDIKTFEESFEDVDRALLEGDEEGFLKVHIDKKSGDIVGATMVGRHAGDMISEITLAMQAGVGLSTIADTIHPYPTTAEAIKHVGDQYNRTRLKGWMSSVLEKYFAWRR